MTFATVINVVLATPVHAERRQNDRRATSPATA
jgi:hypothetical protein